MSDASVLERLSKFIDRESPHMSSFLYRMWGDQQQAITYHELREAILDGGLSIDYLLDWQQDYSQYLSECYAPLAQKAIKRATKDLLFEYGGALCDPVADAMDEYITKHGGKLIREISTKQFNAINTLVRQATMTDTMTVGQLAKAIRPCIGLTQYQSGMVKRFYEQLREQGVPHKKALKRQMVYAAKLHRERADLIAQTEMATTYNAATKKVVKDSIEQGVVGADSERYWLDADDERVCDKCGGIDGEVVGTDEPFSNGIMDPPAHPGCRCGVGYKLKAATKQHTNEWVNSLSESERAAITDYTGASYSAINNYMAGDERYGTVDVRTKVTNVKSALDKASLPNATLVKRGTGLKEVVTLFGGNPERYYRYEELEKLQSLVGNVGVNKRFMSTSLGEVLPQYARSGVVMHIALPKGAQAADITSLSVHGAKEREMLINSGHRMRLDSVQAECDEEGFVHGTIHVFIDVLDSK